MPLRIWYSLYVNTSCLDAEKRDSLKGTQCLGDDGGWMGIFAENCARSSQAPQSCDDFGGSLAPSWNAGSYSGLAERKPHLFA